MRRFTTYTDESGVVSKGKKFIVVTAIVENERRELFEKVLNEVERESGKRKKWADVGLMTRTRYTSKLLKHNIFKLCTVYYSVHYSKADYISLVASQITKSIIDFSGGDDYAATIFVDLVSRKTTDGIQREIKRYKIRHKKIRALDDTNSVGLKLVDAMCELIRDINNKDIDSSYKMIFKKLRNV